MDNSGLANTFKRNNLKKLYMYVGIGTAILLIIIFIIFLLFNNSTNSQTNTTIDKNTSLTLNIWGLWENKDDIDALGKEFQKSYPNIKIEYTNREKESDTNESKYKYDLVTRINSNSGITSPDIVLYHNEWEEYLQKYLTTIPTNIYSDQEYKNTFYSLFYNSLKGTDSKLYGVPYYIDNYALFYNKKLLKVKSITTPANNWNDLKKQVRELSVRDSKNQIITSGLSAGTLQNVDFGYESLISLMMQNSVQFLNKDGKSTPISTDERAAEALKFYNDFIPESNSWDQNQPSDSRLFLEGKLAMMVAPLWRAYQFYNLNSDLDFDIAPIPQLYGASQNINYGYGWVYGVPKNSTKSTAAWTFIKFLSSKEAIKILNDRVSKSRGIGFVSARIDQNEEFTNTKFLSTIAKQAPNSTSIKWYDREACIDVFKRNIGNGLSPNTLLSISSAQSTLIKIGAEINTILAKKNVK